jgi:iron complex outermembrane recepter protein
MTIAFATRCTRMRVLFYLAGLCLSGTTFAQMSSDKVHVDIPAQSLSSALTQFGRDTGTEIVFTPEAVNQKVSTAIKGDFAKERAIALMLAGTGLSYRVTAQGAVVIGGSTSPDKRKEQTSGAGLATTETRIAKSATGEQETLPAGGELIDVDQESKKNAGLEEIVVTGTYLHGESPVGSPLIVISRSDIEAGGYTSLGEVMTSLPQDFGGGQNINAGNANNGPIGGTNDNDSFNTTANLRGIGPESTLTLLDGHRLVSSGFHGNAVDLSVIPLSAIERVEILPDGASAIYGSDAVAGVVNVRLRDHYQGVEGGATFGYPTQGGGDERRYHFLGGTEWGSGGAFISAEYDDQSPLLTTQRDLVPDPTQYPPSSLVPSKEQTSVLARISQELTPDIAVYADGVYGHRIASSNSQFYLGSEVASLPIFGDDTQYDIIVGLNAKLPEGWKLAASIADGHDDTSLDSPQFIGGAMVGGSVGDFTNESRYAELETDGPVIQLPSGEIRLAVGGGYRYESYVATSGADLTDETTTALSRHIEYGFSELRVPVISEDKDRWGLTKFVATAAVRYEHYSDFGSTTNPKFGLEYAPLSSITIRASAGTSFRAPELAELIGQSDAVLDAIPDPTSPTGTTLTLIRGGASRSLNPETAHEWSVGFDVKPSGIDGLVVSPTYYHILYDNQIGDPVSTWSDLLTSPIYAPIVTRNPSAALLNSVINSVDEFYNYSGAPYNPATVGAYVAGGLQNIGRQDIHGVDALAQYSWVVAGNRMAATVNAAWLDFTQEIIAGTAPTPVSGLVFAPSHFRARAGLTWERGPLEAAAFANYIDGELDNTSVPYVRVSSWATFDLQAGYSVKSPIGKTNFSIAVKNLLDRAPPFVRADATNPVTGIGYDTTNADAFGRVVRLSVTESW